MPDKKVFQTFVVLVNAASIYSSVDFKENMNFDYDLRTVLMISTNLSLLENNGSK